MAKDLTDKMRADMAKVQVNFIKRNHPGFLNSEFYPNTLYDLLEKYLAKGLSEYSSEKVRLNREVDITLLKSLQDGNNNTASSLINAAMVNNFNGTNFDESIKDKHLVKLYKNNEHARRYIVNYGPKTSKLLSDYLTKKGLIEGKK